jgi:hypothetical protein
VLGGLLSVFPMIITATFVSLWLTNGSSVVAGSVGAMIVGQLGIGAYCIFFALLVPLLEIPGAAAAALALAVVTVSLPTFFGLRARGAVSQRSKLDIQTESALVIDIDGERNETPNDASLAAVQLEFHQTDTDNSHRSTVPLL